MGPQKSRTRLSDFHYDGLGVNLPAHGKHSRSFMATPPGVTDIRVVSCAPPPIPAPCHLVFSAANAALTQLLPFPLLEFGIRHCQLKNIVATWKSRVLLFGVTV